MSKKLIEEIYGMGNEVRDQAPQTYHQQSNQWRNNPWYNEKIDAMAGRANDREKAVRLDPKPKIFPLTDWQQEIYDRIVTKDDTFAGIPPAAGKTGPLLGAWFELLTTALNAHVPFNSPQFPRILYIAKTKQLAMEGIMQNFQENSKHGLYNLLAENRFYLSILADVHKNPDTPLTPQEQKKIFQTVQELSCIRFGGIDKNVIKSPKFVIKPIIVTTPITSGDKSVSALVKEYSQYFSIICIDEFQEYIPKPGRDVKYGQFTDDISKNFDMILDIIKYAQPPGKCGIQILTGTVNQQTAKNFCKAIKDKYHRNFKDIIKWDHPDTNVPGAKNYAGNRSNLTIVPFEKMNYPKDRENLVVDIVKNKQERSIMIIFSVRRTASTGIFNLLSKVIPRLPARDPAFLIDEPIPRDASAKNIADRMKDSENYINPNFNPDAYAKGVIDDKDDFVRVNDIEFLKYFDVDKAEQMSGDDTKLDNVKAYSDTANPNNYLYQGVLRGIGLMIGKMDNRMKGTIQKLFRSGKIYMLLATDSLGIGANVLAKFIYIHSLQKPDEGGFADIDSSSLIQLVNRAGRDSGKIPNAFIYCSLKDYDRVKKAINSDPSLFVDEIPFDEMENKIKNKDNLLRALGKELFG